MDAPLSCLINGKRTNISKQSKRKEEKKGKRKKEGKKREEEEKKDTDPIAPTKSGGRTRR